MSIHLEHPLGLPHAPARKGCGAGVSRTASRPHSYERSTRRRAFELRTAVADALRCSTADAERLVDTLVRRGLVHVAGKTPCVERAA